MMAHSTNEKVLGLPETIKHFIVRICGTVSWCLSVCSSMLSKSKQIQKNKHPKKSIIVHSTAQKII